jgi:serine/threonine-protein kinase
MPDGIGQEVPERIGDWQIERRLGEGGMGSVYLGRSQSTGLEMAVKVLPKGLAMRDDRYRERFFREASIATRMQHPNMVQVHDSGEEGLFYYLVMDFVQGGTCRDEVERNGPLGWERAVAITIQVATGLEYALSRGIIHRDVSPGNIMIDADGTARIADLGLAKESAAEFTGLTRTGSSLGTPYYMSPEQIKNARDVDFRADIYSLGATLYYLICGTVPYTGTTFEVMTKQVSEPLPDPRLHVPDLPESLCEVLRKMMAKSADDRYADYSRLRDDLNAVLRRQKVSAEGFTDSSMVARPDQSSLSLLTPGALTRSMEKTVIIEPTAEPKKKPQLRTALLAGLLVAALVIILLLLLIVF